MEKNVLLYWTGSSVLQDDMLDTLTRKDNVTIVVPDASQVDDVPRIAKAFDRVSRVIAAQFDDLALDLCALEEHLSTNPPKSMRALRDVEEMSLKQKAASPLVADASVDLIIAVSVLRTVRADRAKDALGEMFRVLRRGGILILTEVVSDEPLSPRLLEDSENPASFQELELLEMIEAVGFHGIYITRFEMEPCCSIEGIEMRKMTVEAHKGKQGACLERYQGVIYKGPWKMVEDDDGHILKRGQRFAVCDKTFNIYKREPYAGQFIYLEPAVDVPFECAQPWDVRHPAERLPAETKGQHIPHPAATPTIESGGYIARIEWRRRDGTLERRAKVSDRYRGAFTTADEALATARRAFPDASRILTEAISAEEVLSHRQQTGKAPACPLPVRRATL